MREIDRAGRPDVLRTLLSLRELVRSIAPDVYRDLFAQNSSILIRRDARANSFREF
jgi:hypothetical protein